MDYKEYMNRLKDRYETPYIQIPNKLISELNDSLRKHELQRYTDYGFSFLVVNGFLYKYSHYLDYEESDYLLLSDIKRILKYNPNNQNINKVSKKGSGVLDYESFVEVTDDIPVSIEYVKEKNEKLELRVPIRLSEMDWVVSDEIKYNVLKNRKHEVYIPEYMIDYPAKKGTLNNYDNTTKITYKEFEYFILSDDMNLKDFLVYCFIKSTATSSGEAHISYDRAQRGMGLSRMTFLKVVDKLEDMNIISVKKGGNVHRFKKSPNILSIKPSFMKKVGIKRL